MKTLLTSLALLAVAGSAHGATTQKCSDAQHRVAWPHCRHSDADGGSRRAPGERTLETMAIGKAGAINAALLAVAVLANSRPELREKLRAYRNEQTETVLQNRALTV